MRLTVRLGDGLGNAAPPAQARPESEPAFSQDPQDTQAYTEGGEGQAVDDGLIVRALCSCKISILN